MNRYPWPDESKAVVFFSVNFDAEALDLTATTEDRLYGRYTYGRYGPRAGMPRLLDLLDKYSIRATFFICADDARRHSAAVRDVMKRGHEIAARGMDMKDLASLGDQEYETLRAATDTLSDICAERPKGFRAPGNSLSTKTLGYIAELGYKYDSSFQDDDYPYSISVGTAGTLVEIPTCYALEDAPVYSARHTHARLVKIWDDEFSAMYADGTLIPLTVHLRGDVGSTRAARIDALDGFLARVTSQGDVSFMTGTELAAHAESAGRVAEPDPVEAHLSTLRDVPYRGDLYISNSAYKRG